MPGFSIECATKLISNAIHFTDGPLFLRRHLRYSSRLPILQFPTFAVIGYVSSVVISTVPSDDEKVSALKQVAIYCDGSSLGNGQEASRAAGVALLGYKGYWKAVGEYLGKATNQQAEIAAAAVGLESLKQPCQVSLFTDSRYVVETMNGRFRRKTNLPWWQRLDRAASAHKIHWKWTRGHAGHVLQEAADKAARRIAAAGHAEQTILRDAEDQV